MKRFLVLTFACILLWAAAARAASLSALPEDDPQAARTQEATPTSDLGYKSDPFKKEQKPQASPEPTVRFQAGADSTRDPVTGAPLSEPDMQKAQAGVTEADPKQALDAVGGKVQMDVDIMKF